MGQMITLTCQHGVVAAGLRGGGPDEQIDQVFSALVDQGSD
jgi:hypothetical protein